MPALSLTSAAKAGAATTAISAVQSATNGTINVDTSVYSLIAVVLALIGIFLSRLVTIETENKRLGRTQTWRETGPLTWIAVLIVCPFIWHFEIEIPWAPLIGVSVGYSVRIILRILGGGAQSAARAMARQAVEALSGMPPLPPGSQEEADAEARLLGKLDEE